MSPPRANALVVKVDGIDGCGKTTLIGEIAHAFSNSRVLQMLEFGNALDLPVRNSESDRTVSEILRELALCPTCEFDDIERELLWCICSRRTNRLVLPRYIKSYDLILVDRSNLGNLAYGMVLNRELELLYQLVTTPEEGADLILWLDTPVHICMDRLRNRVPDLIESKGTDFFEAVRQQYQRLTGDPKVKRIDGSLAPKAILEEAIVSIQAASVRASGT